MSRRVEALERQLYSRMPLLGGWVRRGAVRALAAENTLEAARALADAVIRSDDARVRAFALSALRGVSPRHFEAACAAWERTRNPSLGHLLGERRRLQQAPLRVRVLYALLHDRADAVEAEGSKAVEPLLQLCRDADADVASRARRALRQLASPDARKVLCRAAMQQDDAEARAAVLDANLTPADPRQRALFYFLTGQWDRCADADFDGSQLRAAYRAADDGLRQRVAEAARRSGRVEWVEALAGGSKHFADMSDAEWETAAEVLAAARDWPRTWCLAQQAPATWAAALLRHLRAAGWSPPDCGDFDRLAGLAAAWDADALVSVVRPGPTLPGHGGAVQALAISPDGRLLVSGCADKVIRVWSLPAADEVRHLEGHTAAISALAMGKDGILASAVHDRTVRLWRLSDGEALQILRGHEDRVRCIALSPDGRYVASGSDDATLRVWDPADGRLVAKLRGHDGAVTGVAFTPDGQALLSGGLDGTVRLWALPDGAPLRLLEHREYVTSLSLSADGRLLAVGCYDRSVRLWRLPEGQPLTRLEGHRESVTCVALSADGTLLASSGLDRSVMLWRLPEGRPLRHFPETTGAVAALAISPDGRLLARGGEDRTLRLTDLLPLWLARAPFAAMKLSELSAVEQALGREGLEPEARRSLEFLAAMLRWRHRADIAVSDAPRRAPGQFDVELQVGPA